MMKSAWKLWRTSKLTPPPFLSCISL
jgi:hypothetical protein